MIAIKMIRYGEPTTKDNYIMVSLPFFLTFKQEQLFHT